MRLFAALLEEVVGWKQQLQKKKVIKDTLIKERKAILKNMKECGCLPDCGCKK